MQIVIDIPEEHYRTLQEAMKNHMESLVGKIILNGTPIPDNATNGDMIKALFSDEIVECSTSSIWYGDLLMCDAEWWNAPYQKGGKE